MTAPTAPMINSTNVLGSAGPKTAVDALAVLVTEDDVARDELARRKSPVALAMMQAIKRALVSALALTGVERQRRMEAMRATVRSHDVHHWARHFLERLEDVAPAGERARSMRWRSASSRLRGYLSLPEPDGSLDVARDHDHSGRQLSGIRLDTGVVVVNGMTVVEDHSGRNSPPSDTEEVQFDDSHWCAIFEEAGEEAPAGGPAFGRREQAVLAPALLVQVDELVQVAQRVGRTLQSNLARVRGAADLAANLVAVLLAQRPQVALEVQAGRELQDRADLLALADHRPTVRACACRKRDLELVGSRIAASQPSQVDDVPRLRRPVVGCQ